LVGLKVTQRPEQKLLSMRGSIPNHSIRRFADRVVKTARERIRAPNPRLRAASAKSTAKSRHDPQAAIQSLMANSFFTALPATSIT
jgi:hypothetical protein